MASFPVVRLMATDEAGWVYFTAHAETRIYDTHLYRVDFDGTRFRRLTEGKGMHIVSFSPNKQYFIDNWSSVDTPPISELRASDGRLLQVLSRSSLAEIVRRGWRVPEEFPALAAGWQDRTSRSLIQTVESKPAPKIPLLGYDLCRPIPDLHGCRSHSLANPGVRIHSRPRHSRNSASS